MNNQTSSGSALGMAVVTGASSGIGKVYAERLAKRGYDPILVARRTERLEALSRELQQRYSVEVEPLVADLGQETDIARVAHVLRAAERITMLVNNAGTSTLRPSLEMPIATVNNLTDVNAKSVAELSLAVLPGFVQRDSGTLINILRSKTPARGPPLTRPASRCSKRRRRGKPPHATTS